MPSVNIGTHSARQTPHRPSNDTSHTPVILKYRASSFPHFEHLMFARPSRAPILKPFLNISTATRYPAPKASTTPTIPAFVIVLNIRKLEILFNFRIF